MISGPIIRQYGDKKVDARKLIQKELTTKLEEARKSTVKKDREACYLFAYKSRLVIRERREVNPASWKFITTCSMRREVLIGSRSSYSEC